MITVLPAGALLAEQFANQAANAIERALQTSVPGARSVPAPCGPHSLGPIQCQANSEPNCRRILALIFDGSPNFPDPYDAIFVANQVQDFQRWNDLRYLLSSFMLMRITIVSLVVWMSFALVWSTVAFRDKPYGLRRLEALILMLLGPLRLDIRDYDPNEEVAPSSPDRSRS
jgi:hypothetical protein